MVHRNIIYKGIKAADADTLPPDTPQEERRQAVLGRIIEAVLASNEIEVLPALVEEEVQMKMLQYRHRLQYESMSSAIHYGQIHGRMQEHTEELKEKFRNEAVFELRTQKLLQAVIAGEGLTVSPEELEEEALAMAARQQVPPEMVRNFLGEDYGMLRRDLLEKKALKFLYESAALC